MLQLSLDTSFLISFADPTRPHHAVALEYFGYCVEERVPMWISTVAAGEFEIKQPVRDLPLQNFRIQPYNLPHAIRAAEFFRKLQSESTPREDVRSIIINDLKIIAQAAEEKIPFIVTEDENTLVRLVNRLRGKNATVVGTLLLKEGFGLKRAEGLEQTDLGLSE
jgi:predicted nucleic acid-binding protein